MSEKLYIPAGIWYDNRLTLTERFVYAAIDDHDFGLGCRLSNDEIASFCECSSKTVSRTISKLKKLGLIEQVSFDGRERILKSNSEQYERG